MAHDERERTYRWNEPTRLVEAARELSGLELLLALKEGRLPAPPAADLVGMTALDFSDGRAVFELDPADYQYNPLGSVHGGVLTILADSACGCAVHTKLAAGQGYTTLEIKVNFTRAVTAETGRLRAEATVLSFGRRVATSEARITDARDRLVAHATSTLLILS